jgi:hypothetical protein
MSEPRRTYLELDITDEVEKLPFYEKKELFMTLLDSLRNEPTRSRMTIDQQIKSLRDLINSDRYNP